MGLCKCSRRRVTNLFCFVHRVNVCEDCIISQHPRTSSWDGILKAVLRHTDVECIIQSYLHWLEDSDYDAHCALCTNSLLQGDVIRLTCYDLFHTSCLENYFKTISCGDFVCPQCKTAVVPPKSVVSPVAQVLSSRLKLVKRNIPADTIAVSAKDVTSSHQNVQKSTSLQFVPRYDSGHQGRSALKKWYILPIIFFTILAIFVCLRLLAVSIANKDPTLDWKFNPNIHTND